MAIIVLASETDQDVSGDNFGTVTLEDAGVGQVDFLIDLDNLVLGPDADVHQFGFQTQYSGPLSINPGIWDLTTNKSIAGIGGIKWNFRVSLGNGQPQVDPAAFSLLGDSSFDVQSILDATPLAINGDNALMAVHAQSTSTPAGSETVYGDHSPVSEPASIFVLLALAVTGFVCGIRKGLAL